uniref:Glyco_18 domain-containing protein n=1 Tax=Caenorhabditis tropicalis TaxID=1561998 RepID=A0A1I7UCF6_9PELO
MVFADTEKRRSFIGSLTTFLTANKIDGLEIIWTFPFAELTDRVNMVTFFKELREELTNLEHKTNRTDPYVISMLTPQVLWKQLEGYDLDGILKYADFLNVVSYEFYGPWSQKEGAFTGPVGPLYGGKRGNIDDTMRVHTCETMKPSQLTLGIPLFGKFWKNVKEEKINQTETLCKKEICRIADPVDISDLWREAELENEKPEGGLISWNDRENDEVGIFWDRSQAKWHNISKSAFIWRPKERVLITFETKESIEEKVKYAIEKNMGGINLWSLNMDDEMDTVLNLVSSMNMCNTKPKNQIMYNC